ncbi:adenosine deaminase, putative [Perkinsus marinus ATCC 50983]|uniref:adenosine deaminase n=1 Tax=Perkinsus marinus (strain ATCC 50983 / TXsc) TaxID=423536 RepID=C5LTA8_PERM5|nr:adenosine deaminase, putative [Perkinsus marinus ATCC 50983]EER00076.1 adenosine deaminase, putative [Perkinsus marinus ATCC 50983]|eukprot:XP_002767358.1 adenosine deaminase, putative [Perkinsus marinus ATCC 50983]
MDEFGINVKQILCCMNRNPEMSADIADLAIEFKSSGVVGIDVASGELHFNRADLREAHIKACRRAKAAGLHVTIHAAEDGPGRNFCCAVTEYLAERIGHGYRIHDQPHVDEKLYQQAKDSGAHIEACPTSSICTEAVCLPQVHPEKPILDSLDWNRHPIKKFIEDGLSVSISTDGGPVFSTDLTRELSILVDRFHFDAHKVGSMVTIAAIDHCWADDEEKERYRKLVYAYYDV